MSLNTFLQSVRNKTMTLSPKESGKYIALNATYVKINPQGIDKLADVITEELDSGRLKPANFSQATVHPKPDDPQVLDWLFVVDTLNFCFWCKDGEEGKLLASQFVVRVIL